MKIATLTFQRHDNIGAMLQCYALQNTIKRKGHENEIIDYICDAADRTFSYKSLRVKGIKKYLTSCIGVVSRLPKKAAFNKFRKYDLLMTRKCNRMSINKLDGKYDGYIVGSDNVWNSRLTGLDTNYFLSFVSDKRKIASYAASLGMEAIPKNEIETFKKYLQQFMEITLREKSAADHMKAILSRDVSDTCDPTFFLSKDEWMRLSVAPKEKYKYVLVYHMSPSTSFVRFAREFSKIKGLPMIYVPFPYGLCKCSVKPQIGPREWLGYVNNAEYIITDSFHGCVFSSIYEKNLIIKISQLGARIDNLAEKLGIQDRLVHSVDQAVMLPKQDYSNVRERIAEYRRSGEETLNQILDGFSRSLRA